MTYINPAFRERQNPVAMLPGAVAPDVIEAQVRDVTPPPAKRFDDRHVIFCAALALPATLAVLAYMFGDLRACAIFCLMGIYMGMIGWLTLDGPA